MLRSASSSHTGAPICRPRCSTIAWASFPWSTRFDQLLLQPQRPGQQLSLLAQDGGEMTEFAEALGFSGLQRAT